MGNRCLDCFNSSFSLGLSCEGPPSLEEDCDFPICIRDPHVQFLEGEGSLDSSGRGGGGGTSSSSL